MANKKAVQKGKGNAKVEAKKSKNLFILGIVAIAVVAIGAGIIISFLNGGNSGGTPQATKTPATEAPGMTTPVKVEFTMADGGKMLFELLPQYAPKTVANFVKLTNEKFFDGLKFHRIMKTFMVQGGDGSTDPNKPQADSIVGEFAQNGFPQNTLSHTYGVISMAKTSDPNSATSQFFIVTGDATFLDGGYAAFGRLISGKATLNKIANTPVEQTGEKSTPTVDVIIKSVRVVG